MSLVCSHDYIVWSKIEGELNDYVPFYNSKFKPFNILSMENNQILLALLAELLIFAIIVKQRSISPSLIT